MKTLVLIVLALAFAAPILAFSSAEAAMVRPVPDVTAIASAPAVTIATERLARTRTGTTNTAD